MLELIKEEDTIDAISRHWEEVELFWNNVDIKEKDDCWNWKYGKSYGGTIYNGKYYACHRLAWELVHGSIPKGMWVLHKCDNPRCVNPNHLFLGNRLDNIYDAVKKGRWRKKIEKDILDIPKIPDIEEEILDLSNILRLRRNNQG